MQNNGKEKGTWRSKSITNPPALLWQDLLCCRELSQAGETGSVCPDLPTPLPRPGSLHAHTPSQWCGNGQGGIIQEEEAEEELWLCSAWRGCWLCAWQGGGRAVNHPAGWRGCRWLPAPGARVALPLSPCFGVTAGCAGQGELTLTMGRSSPGCLWEPWVNPLTHSHPHPPRKQQTLLRCNSVSLLPPLPEPLTNSCCLLLPPALLWR